MAIFEIPVQLDRIKHINGNFLHKESWKDKCLAF